MDWTTNTIMMWGASKVSDHSRGPLDVTTERIGTDKRMANGTLRRHHVGIKRTWAISWASIPSINDGGTGYMKTADGGMAGRDIEDFVYANPGKFRMVLKNGSASGVTTPTVAEGSLPYEDDNFYMANVMITDFSHQIIKRGVVDLWSVNVTLEEV